MTSPEQRQYECILLGATGYTGRYTAEHITTHLPTDFQWAIAGRSEHKLNDLAAELRALNVDRQQPGIEVVQLIKADLLSLVRKTKVLITTIGPYHKYGAAAFEACAESGTHYLDCTGEVPWVYDMTHKYGEIAKRSGAIMIPQNGVESAPADLMSWMLVTHIRRTLSVGTAELINTLWDINSSPSGGTLATVLTLLDSYSLSQVAKAMSPFSLCTVQPPPRQRRRKPLIEALTGVRTDTDLGILTDSIQGPTDAPIVNRSWSLIDGGQLYGPNFQLNSYMRARSRIHACAIHVALTLGMAALVVSPVRWLIRKFVYQPGEGKDKAEAKKEHCEWRAVANADVVDPNDPKRAHGRMRWEGSMYDLTGTCLSEAAVTLSRDTTLARGGVMTPATLGAPYLARLQAAGLQTEVKTIPS